ncbi:hypothetical protein SRHO_G00076000 [Serrasalmus rhombeus]
MMSSQKCWNTMCPPAREVQLEITPKTGHNGGHNWPSTTERHCKKGGKEEKTGGRFPLMEDEEEDLPLPSHCCGRPLEDRATTNRATLIDNSTPSSGGGGRMPLLQTIPRCRATGSATAPPCGTAGPLHRPLHSTVGLGLVSSPTGSAEETRALLHSLIFFPEGDPGFAPHFPATSEPNLPAAREEEQEQEEEGEGRPEGKEEDAQEGMSVEVQIGRKLREIGDQFQQEHLETFMQYQRGQLPGWWRLATTLYNLLFPREAIGPRGAQR